MSGYRPSNARQPGAVLLSPLSCLGRRSVSTPRLVILRLLALRGLNASALESSVHHRQPFRLRPTLVIAASASANVNIGSRAAPSLQATIRSASSVTATSSVRVPQHGPLSGLSCCTGRRSRRPLRSCRRTFPCSPWKKGSTAMAGSAEGRNKSIPVALFCYGIVVGLWIVNGRIDGKDPGDANGADGWKYAGVRPASMVLAFRRKRCVCRRRYHD